MGKGEKETAFIGLLLYIRKWAFRCIIMYYIPTTLKAGYFPHVMDEKIEIQGITKMIQSMLNSEGIVGHV